MRRLARYTFTALSVLSLLLCVATAWLWMRSYYGTDRVGRIWSHWYGRSYYTKAWGAQSSLGKIGIADDLDVNTCRDERAAAGMIDDGCVDGAGWLQPCHLVKYSHLVDPSYLGTRRFIGFAFMPFSGNVLWRNAVTTRSNGVHIEVPHWAVMLLTAIAPAIRLRALGRKRRVLPGNHCAACGYDLRATPDRCPECGTIVTNGKE